MTEETLFHEALAKPAADRAAFLDEKCAGGPELRAAVEAVLSAHEASGSFLNKPAPAAALDNTGEYTPDFRSRPWRRSEVERLRLWANAIDRSLR